MWQAKFKKVVVIGSIKIPKVPKNFVPTAPNHANPNPKIITGYDDYDVRKTSNLQSLDK